jgi:hypothetical protein
MEQRGQQLEDMGTAGQERRWQPFDGFEFAVSCHSSVVLTVRMCFCKVTACLQWHQSPFDLGGIDMISHQQVRLGGFQIRFENQVSSGT